MWLAIGTLLLWAINFVIKELDEADQVNQQVKLTFLNSKKKAEVILIFKIPQLHKLIGEIFKKVGEWDLSNPWQDKCVTHVVSNNRAGVVH